MRIYLRPINEKDGKLIVRWRNSEKVRSHCMTKSPLTEENHLRFYREKVLSGKYIQFIVERIDEDFGLSSYPIATVYLKDIDYENLRCELCVFTSDEVEWNAEGQAIAIKMLLDKAFSEYKMHKVYSYVFYKNNEEVELLKAAGFLVESIMKEEAANEDGVFEDVIRMCVFNNE